MQLRSLRNTSRRSSYRDLVSILPVTLNGRNIRSLAFDISSAVYRRNVDRRRCDIAKCWPRLSKKAISIRLHHISIQQLTAQDFHRAPSSSAAAYSSPGLPVDSLLPSACPPVSSSPPADLQNSAVQQLQQGSCRLETAARQRHLFLRVSFSSDRPQRSCGWMGFRDEG